MEDREHDTEANSGNERRDHRRATVREHRESPGGAGRRHCVRARRTARPTALWPFGAAASESPHGVLGWLEQVLAALITGYTEPGQRVCLLIGPRCDSSRDTITGSEADAPHPYERLTEAAGVITRLGRTVVIATVEDLQSKQHSADTESESGPRPDSPGPCSPHPDRSRRDAGPGADGACGSFALIITTADPALHSQGHGWLAELDWHRLLTSTATLAVITHSDYRAGSFVDPLPQILNTLRHRAMGWWEAIAVLDQPLDAPRADPGEAAQPDPANTPAEPGEIRPVHHDLLLFAPDPDRSRSPEPAGAAVTPVEPEQGLDQTCTADRAFSTRCASVWPTGTHSLQRQLDDRGYHPLTPTEPDVMPPALAAYAVNTWSRPGETVFDPDCGAGTTLVEAARADRKALGLTSSQRDERLTRANLQAAYTRGVPIHERVLLGQQRTRPPAAGEQASLSGQVGLVLSTVALDETRSVDSHSVLETLSTVLKGYRFLLRPGGHVVLILPTRRHPTRGHLLDLTGPLLELAECTGLRPLARCLALTASVRGQRVRTHADLAPRRTSDRITRETGRPCALATHHTALVFRIHEDI